VSDSFQSYLAKSLAWILLSHTALGRTHISLMWLEELWASEYWVFNPLSAMVIIWHHIIVSVKVLAQKGFIWTCIFSVKCSSEMFIMAKGVVWSVGVSWKGCEGWVAHSAEIHQSLLHKSRLHSGEYGIENFVPDKDIYFMLFVMSSNYSHTVNMLHCG
jgi:hypothetical protein